MHLFRPNVTSVRAGCVTQRLGGVTMIALFGSAMLQAASASDRVWQESIGPLLETNCGPCHSDRLKTSGFSVSNLKSVIAGGNKHGKAVMEGHPDQSPLVRML